MLNYVYFCLTYNEKEVMKGNHYIKSSMKELVQQCCLKNEYHFIKTL